MHIMWQLLEILLHTSRITCQFMYPFNRNNHRQAAMRIRFSERRISHLIGSLHATCEILIITWI